MTRVAYWLDSARFVAPDPNYNFAVLSFVELLTLERKCLSKIDILKRNGGLWRHVGPYGYVMDAYECIRKHTVASACILGTRYKVLGTGYWVLGTRY